MISVLSDVRVWLVTGVADTGWKVGRSQRLHSRPH